MHESERPDGQAGPQGAIRRPAGALEAEILGIVRTVSEPLGAGEVRERIAAGEQQALSYSTVVTIMSRLYDKGLLARERAGRGFTYSAVDEASLAANRMSSALQSGIDRGAVLGRFVSGLSGRDARLLRSLLADARDASSDGPGLPRARD